MLYKYQNKLHCINLCTRAYILRSIVLLSFDALSFSEVCFSSRWSIVEERQKKMASIHYSLGTSSAALPPPQPPPTPNAVEQLQLRHPSDRRGADSSNDCTRCEWRQTVTFTCIYGWRCGYPSPVTISFESTGARTPPVPVNQPSITVFGREFNDFSSLKMAFVFVLVCVLACGCVRLYQGTDDRAPLEDSQKALLTCFLTDLNRRA